MKRKYSSRRLQITASLWVLVLLIASSCQKSFLETIPKGKLIAQNVSDYDLLLNNNTLLNTGGANAQVYLGDEVAVVEPYFSAIEPRTKRLFQWQPDVYETDQDAPETQALLSQLYIYNKIINEVMEASGGSEEQKNAIRSEALAGRAWVYFMLINYFGKPYEPETADADLGFPIIQTADVTATQFSRASVQEVYDFIEADLVTAIPLLPAQTTHRLRMSKAAAEALLGKVYVFMGRYEEALPLLNKALSHIVNSAVPIHLTDYNDAFAPGGEYMPIEIFGPSMPTITEDPQTLYARQFSNFWVLSSELVIAPETVALFDTSDLRLFFYAETPFPIGPTYPAGLLRRMGPITTSYGVVLPDIILLRAECRARLNDLAGCVEDLEWLRQNRMPVADAPVPAAVSAQQQSLFEFVLDERIREFACQGMRWFDMRRLSVDPLFSALEYKHQIYGADGTAQEFSLSKERLVLKIPPKILAENSGMQDNP